MLVFLSTNILRILSIVDAPVPEWASVAVFVTYLLGRTKYYRYSIACFIVIVNILPYYILIVYSVSDPQNVFTALIWVPIFVLLASFLMGIKETTVITILNSLTIIFLPLLITDMMLLELGYLISYTITMSVTIVVGSFLRERYLSRITRQRSDLRKRMEELEFLSSLVKHDLSNDLDIILRSSEILRLESSESSVRDKVDIIDASGVRMKSLLSVLEQITESEELDFISMIESVAAHAMKIHHNLKVEVKYDLKVKDQRVEGNRLLPLAFENLIRNIAAHAGENPIALIQIEYDNSNLTIDVSDNGPGLSVEAREHLFERGSVSNGRPKGQGLYLTKSIIESHGGTIKLLDENNLGASFRIVLKAS
jgi:signal transduction histidine kinase